MISGSIHQEDIIIINIHAPSNEVPKLYEAKTEITERRNS